MEEKLVKADRNPNLRKRSFSSLPRLFFGLVAGCAALAGSATIAAAAPAIVQTENGPVKGIVTSGLREFLGIPYAAPPVRDLRWQPPQAHARWFAPINAPHFGNHCPQVASPFGVASTTEDCLFLNVFTPSRNNGKSPVHARPVMVWIHGGAFVGGEKRRLRSHTVG